MTEADIVELAAWVAEAGLAGRTETELVAGVAERLSAAGMPLLRAQVFVDTLHPVHEGRIFRWDRDQAVATLSEYARGADAEAEARWRGSPFFRLLETGESLLRRRVSAATVSEFSFGSDLLAAGVADYVAIVNRFAGGAAVGEMDCVYSSWLSDDPEGFSDVQIAALARIAPFLALAVKSASLGRIAETLVATYLGRDAGRRVLGGHIARGVSERIEAVLWFSDLRNYTRLSDTEASELIIPMLNDYSDAIILAIHKHGGDVLKFIGDGILAIFPAADRAAACSAALSAALGARKKVEALTKRRAGEGLPATDMYLGLHVGEVFYGNIGAKERLDFTVIGPAVNEVSRIAAMCRSADQPVLFSSTFAESVVDQRERVVSVGRFALRGVARPRELFTLDWGE